MNNIIPKSPGANLENKANIVRNKKIVKQKQFKRFLNRAKK